MADAPGGRGPSSPGGPFIPALAGIGFVLAFYVMLMETTSAGARALGGLSIYLHSLVDLVCFAAVAGLSRQGLTLRRRGGVLAATGAAGVLGAVLVMLGAGAAAEGGTPTAWALFAAGTLLASASFSTLVMAWFEELASLSLDYAMLHYIAGGLLAGVLRFARVGLDSLGGALSVCAAVGVCLMPAASAACLHAGAHKVSGRAFASGERALPRWHFPWELVVLLAVFNLASKFTLNLLDENEKGLAATAFVACYGALLIVVAAGFKRFPYRAIRYAALPLMVTGMLCQVNGADFALLGSIATRVAQELLLVLVVALLFDLAFRQGVNALWAFGLTEAFCNVGGLAANLLTGAGAAWLAEGRTATLVVSGLIVLVVTAYVALMSDRAMAGGWGLLTRRTNAASPAAWTGGREAPGTAGSEELAECCSRAARVYDLTRREEDVLLMRLAGATLKEVEDELCIARSTVKSHVRHIYAKLGVESLDGAREAVERAGDRGRRGRK